MKTVAITHQRRRRPIRRACISFLLAGILVFLGLVLSSRGIAGSVPAKPGDESSGHSLVGSRKTLISEERELTLHASFTGTQPEAEGLPTTASPSSMSFGSQEILESCWSPGDLRGTPRDGKVLKPAPFGSTQAPQGTARRSMLQPLAPELQHSIRHVNPNGQEKVVALTFDLCEAPKEISGYDPDIVNMLREKNIKATFFAGGKWMRSHPEKTMQLMADPLFEIGNHTWTHGNLAVLSGKQMEDQILWTQAQYEILWEELKKRPCAEQKGRVEMESIPKGPRVFRFPYGRCSTEALGFLANHGLPAIQWNIVTGDADKHRTAEGISQVILKQVRPGSIIICHANGRGHGTASALSTCIPHLQSLGYRFVTVSELLTSGPAFSAKECYELKPGDNLHYDRKSRGRLK